MLDKLNPDFLNMLYRVPVLLISFMVHELSHALAAYGFGDTTAKDAGRISFNPIRHIDPIGAIMLIAAGFGWAKPVPINPNNFKHKKAGIIVTSLAGPLSNVLLAIIFYASFMIYIVKFRPSLFTSMSTAEEIMYSIFVQFLIVNISLASFNLIPIPPLDGSKVLFSIFPDRIYYNYILKYERYGMVILIALTFTGYLSKILNPIVVFLRSFIEAVVEPLISLLM